MHSFPNTALCRITQQRSPISHVSRIAYRRSKLSSTERKNEWIYGLSMGNRFYPYGFYFGPMWAFVLYCMCPFLKRFSSMSLSKTLPLRLTLREKTNFEVRERYQRGWLRDYRGKFIWHDWAIEVLTRGTKRSSRSEDRWGRRMGIVWVCSQRHFDFVDL